GLVGRLLDAVGERAQGGVAARGSPGRREQGGAGRTHRDALGLAAPTRAEGGEQREGQSGAREHGWDQRTIRTGVRTTRCVGASSSVHGSSAGRSVATTATSVHAPLSSSRGISARARIVAPALASTIRGA